MEKTKQKEDLVVLLSAGHVVAGRANARVSILTQLPIQLLERSSAPERVVEKVLGRLAHQVDARRVLLTTCGSVPHDELVVPVFDVLARHCSDLKIPLIWIPDVVALAALLPTTTWKPNS